MNLNSEIESHVLETPDSNFDGRNSLTSPNKELRQRQKSPNRLIGPHLNKNPVRKKFELLGDITKSNIYINKTLFILF